MAWVKFSRDHNYTPEKDRRQTTRFRAGCSYLVKRECADAVIAAGAAKAIPTPRRSLPVDERFNSAPGEAFDHDGDGSPGGSKPKAEGGS